MKAKEELKELKSKSIEELNRILAVSRETMRDLKFKIAQNQFKDVRAFRALKKKIAKILSLINSQKKK